MIHIPNRLKIDLRSGQKGRNADIDRQPAFDFPDDLAFNDPVISVDSADFIPNQNLGRPFLGK